MNFPLLTAAVLGAATGFAMTAWLILALSAWRRKQRWEAFWYLNLALVNLGSAVVIVGRLFGRFSILPSGFSILLLTPLITLPPALALSRWHRTRQYLSR